jgi:hypothetical protein
MVPFVRILQHLSIAGTALLFATAGARGASQDESVVVYSDLCYHSESGDVLGNRVVVMRFKEGDYVLFQTAEGEIGAPQFGEAVITSRSDEIVFKIKASEKVIATFNGRMSGQFLTGTFDKGWENRSGEKTFRLPRIVGRQRSFPECR